MRRFLTFLFVLVLLVLLADRGAWWFAQRAIAQEIQKSENLSAPAEVSVAGFPFLTQVFRGDYQKVTAHLRDPAVDGGLQIDSLDVVLRGVKVSTGDALKGRVDSVPVDSATATALVSYDSLNAAAKDNLAGTKSTVVFSPGSAGRLAVTGSYRSSGLSAKLDLEASLVADQGDLVVRLDPSALDGLPSALRAQVKSLVATASRLPSLPFGFQARSVIVGPSGVTVQATSATLELER